MQKITMERLLKFNLGMSKEEISSIVGIIEFLLGMEKLRKDQDHYNADYFHEINWIFSTCFNKIQRFKYAVFAVEQVIDIFKKDFPKDKRPEKAIDSVKKYIKNSSEKNLINAISSSKDSISAGDEIEYTIHSFAYSPYMPKKYHHYEMVHASIARAAGHCATADDNCIFVVKLAYESNKEIKSDIINFGIKLLKENMDV